MANTKLLVAASAVVVALASAPMVISSSVDKEIENSKILLEKNGFKQEVLSKSGYFSSQRTFTLEIVDAAKVRDYLLEKLVEKNAQYKVFAQSLKEVTPEEINSVFNGLKFRGDMTNSNLLPSESTMSLILDRLPHGMHAELTNNKELSSVLLPLFTKGVFALDMSFDTRQKLKNLKVRDMKEKIKVEDVTLDVDTANQVLSLNEEGGIVKGKIGVQKQNIGLASDVATLKSNLENFMYDFTFKDDFNNQGKLDMGKYAFELKEMGTTTTLVLGGLKASSTLEEVSNQLQMKADYTFNDVLFSEGMDAIKLKTLLANLKIGGISSQKIKTLQNHYNALLIGTNAPSDEVLINDFVGLINDGITFDFGLAVKELSGIMALKDVSADTKLVIAKNNYSDKQSPLEIVSLIDIASKIKIHKDDKAMLESLALATSEEFALGKVEGDFFVYDVAMKNGALLVNGKPVN